MIDELIIMRIELIDKKKDLMQIRDDLALI